MLLNYLFETFYEESTLLDKCQITARTLNHLIKNNVMPKPSYILHNQGASQSFVSNYTEVQTYRFHLKGHITWLNATENLGIDTEEAAKAYFMSRYDIAAQLFFSGPMGKSLTEIMPYLPETFDEVHLNATWQNFTDGVYGVCTRNGAPESIFLKQAYVRFIDHVIETHPVNKITKSHKTTLLAIVTLLDTVESDFALHEVYQTSRQRCIIEVRKQYKS